MTASCKIVHISSFFYDNLDSFYSHRNYNDNYNTKLKEAWKCINPNIWIDSYKCTHYHLFGDVQ